jgi:hypothetical protein
MLSAILTPGGAPTFGTAQLADQADRCAAYAPLPGPDGRLRVDPEFELPTSAGPLPWRLVYDSM